MYHQQFPRPVDRIAGEWTPRYMYDFWTPPLLARAAPEAKMLVLLRDPIERFRSGFSLGTSKRQKPNQAALVRLANDQLRRSLYFEQLTSAARALRSHAAARAAIRALSRGPRLATASNVRVP